MFLWRAGFFIVCMSVVTDCSASVTGVLAGNLHLSIESPGQTQVLGPGSSCGLGLPTLHIYQIAVCGTLGKGASKTVFLPFLRLLLPKQVELT